MTTVADPAVCAPGPAEAAPSRPARRQGLRATWRGIAAQPLTTLAGAVVMVFVAGFGIVGADTYWLVALGRDIVSAGAVPDGLPFAAADTSGWPNPLVLAQLCLAALAAAGPGTVLLAQVLAVGGMLALVATDARRRGAGDGATATVLVVLLLGALLPLGIVRLQVFSLVPFALLLLLLRTEHEQPTKRIWLALPLVAVWSNLHGAVLMGVAVIGAHLVFSRLRRRPGETIAVGIATLAALFATPALLGMAGYYHGVLTNVAAQRGSDLWSRPDLGHPADLLMVVAGLGLLLLALRRRPPVWELVAALGLAAATTTSSRHGLWLLLVLATAAAVGSTRRPSAATPLATRAPGLAQVLAGLAVLLALGALVVAPARSEAAAPYGHASAPEIAALAADRVVLAPEPLAESLAAEGATVWAADPIDAFSAGDQAAYLDFLTDGPLAGSALEASDLVVVEPGSASARAVDRVGGFSPVAEIGPFVVLTRTGDAFRTNG